ncbi:hypothetical protein ACIRPK_22475 [Kitasatospora sp. NPDC101801]|uniref:hypothetical protein n=1 Tax=Kitasatospora sp. NPDC101801 TaxID=3364103 RepID=UPI003809CE15
MLEVRASMDAEFRTLLANWWDLARSGDTGGTVHNHVEGSQSGPVVLGRDFSNITFNIHPTATPTD